MTARLLQAGRRDVGVPQFRDKGDPERISFGTKRSSRMIELVNFSLSVEKIIFVPTTRNER